MTRSEYLKSLVALYRIANLSDTEQAESWINPNASALHCHALQIIMRDVCNVDHDDHEYCGIIDSIQIGNYQMTKNKCICKCGKSFHNDKWEDFRFCQKCRKRMTVASEGIGHSNFGQHCGGKVVKRNRAI